MSIHRFPPPVRTFACAAALVLPLAAAPAAAHFLELIPATEIIAEGSDGTLGLDLTFTHPMERGPVMVMAEPIRFGVVGPAGRTDLKGSLKRVERDGKTAWHADYPIKAPGDYLFFVEPAPYWEPGEGRMIIHYTKVVVDAFGAEEGWDAAVGLPVEIEPLVRPYGLWTGNLFRGLVRKDGKPLPFAEVEVEWRNDGTVPPPEGPFVTQVVKADAGGVFSYAMPRAGWWGFAALTEGGKPMKNPEGKLVPVELGGLIWVRARDFPGPKGSAAE